MTFRSISLGAALVLAVVPCAAETPLVIEGAVLRLVDDSQATALSAGVVTQLLVEEGARVSSGQLLARLDDAEQRVAVETAQADLRVAEHTAGDDVAIRYADKVAEASRAELRRSEESVARFPKSVSQSQLDVERLAIRQAKLEAEKARHTQRRIELEAERAAKRLVAAELLLARRRIASPIDGVVVERALRTGEWIEPGQPAFRVVATDRLRAEGFAAGAAASGDLVGRSVRVMTGSVESSGTVSFVSPEIDPVSGQTRVVVLVDNSAGHLRAGTRCQLVIAAETLGEPLSNHSRPTPGVPSR